MIVSEDQVAAALEYLNDDPHPLAWAKQKLANAENRCEELFARAFLAADGSVDARKASAEINKEYVEAKKAKSEAIMDVKRHEARCRSSEMIIEVWRTENANARAAERIR